MTRARELLRAGKARRPRAHDRDALARPARRRLRRDPAFGESMIDDALLDQLDRDRVVIDVEDTRLFARRRTDASGEFRKIVGRVQALDRFAPAAAIHQIVPVGNDVPERAALVAERDAAVHASRALLAQLRLGHLELELAPVLEPFGNWALVRRFAFKFKKA